MIRPYGILSVSDCKAFLLARFMMLLDGKIARMNLDCLRLRFLATLRSSAQYVDAQPYTRTRHHISRSDTGCQSPCPPCGYVSSPTHRTGNVGSFQRTACGFCDRQTSRMSVVPCVVEGCRRSCTKGHIFGLFIDCGISPL